MMAAARAWLTAVVSVTLLLSVVQTLIPKGSLREIASFVGGLLLLAVRSCGATIVADCDHDTLAEIVSILDKRY